MATDALTFSVSGVRATELAFEELSVASQRRIMRKPLRKGAQIVLKAAKADIGPGVFKDSSGATKRSLGIKVGLGKQGIFAVVGARVGQGNRTHNGRLREPSRYLHLINKWLPFIPAALDEHISEVESAIRSEAKVEFEKEARKIAAKSRRTA